MIALLTSGVALGVHIPGLLLADRLKETGARTSTYVLERLLPAEKLRAVAASRELFHRDFRYARLGQRIAADPAKNVPDEAVAELRERWERDRVDTLVVFSGFWLPLVRRVLDKTSLSPRLVVCHVDSGLSPSFRNAGPLIAQAEQVWLADAANSTLPWSVPVTREPPPAWEEREQRLLVHGGGWGMGTYRECPEKLLEAGHAVDLVIHEPDDVQQLGAGLRHFAMDPRWHPWHDDGYPPFAEVPQDWGPDTPVTYARGTGRHGSFDLAAGAAAMVSKPGGGTLLDSLWSATPLVLLAPMGEHEAANADLWCRLGFGIPYEEWERRGFDSDVLRSLHHNIRGADAPRNLATALAARSRL